MNSEWLDFLASRQPAEVAPACALVDLSHLGLIRASGAEAAAFLQGQLTNYTRLISPMLPVAEARLLSVGSYKGPRVSVSERAQKLFDQGMVFGWGIQLPGGDALVPRRGAARPRLCTVPLGHRLVAGSEHQRRHGRGRSAGRARCAGAGAGLRQFRT